LTEEQSRQLVTVVLFRHLQRHIESETQLLIEHGEEPQTHVIAQLSVSRGKKLQGSKVPRFDRGWAA
jgi:hypothetical protein